MSDRLEAAHTNALSGAEATSAGGTLTPSAPFAGHDYSTTFDATENPLSESGVWLNGETDGGDWTDMRSASGYAYGTEGDGAGVYDDSTAILTGTWGPTQTVTAVVRTVNQSDSIIQEVEIRLRSTLSSGVNSGYECLFSARSSTNAYIQLVRWEGDLGDFNQIDGRGGSQYGISDGDTIKAEISGTNPATIKFYIVDMDTPVWTVTDDGTHGGAVFTTGNPGIGTYQQSTTGTNADYGFYSMTATDNGS